VTELPLFPLNTVLFPGGLLPLRIFELRYVDMVGRCMREGGSFGVVLSRSGAEVGEVGATAELGTSARIIDFNRLPDGLLGVTCQGEHKFRVLQRSQRPDGLYVGEVEYIAAEPRMELPPKFQTLADLLRKVLSALGEPYASMPCDYADASWVGCRLAEVLPLSPTDKLDLLALEEPLTRLEWFGRLRAVPGGAA
jgi:Lon protease-like protein